MQKTVKRVVADYSDIEAVELRKVSERNQKARNSLMWFIKATKDNYKQNWHHTLTCQYLRRWMDGEFQNLIISQPPRHGKTEIASIRLPAWILGRNPNARIIATAYSDALASKNNRWVQRVIDSPEYRAIFPKTELISGGHRGSGPRPLRNSDEFEIVGSSGVYRSAGIGGGITGMGADYFLIDDPIKNDKEADSPTYREAIWEWWNATALTRLEENSRVLLIMTRWHEDDLAGRLLAQAKSDPNALQWNELKLDALREDLSNSDDPRVLGEPLWPAKYPEKRLLTLKSSLGPRWWNALYQQTPTAKEGGIIKKAWIQYYREFPPTWHKLFQSWDLTFKEGKATDFVVGQLWGVYGRHKYLIDQVRARMGFVDSKDALLDFSKKWPNAYKKLIEAKANGEAIVDALKRDEKDPQTGKVIRQGVTGLVLWTPTASKAERLDAVSDQFRAGDILYPHPEIAPWVAINTDEIVTFPNATHDDTVDATTQALLDLLGPGNSVLDRITKL